MPTYDYQCVSCSHQFEVFHAISAEPVLECPVCGSPVKRLIGGGTGLIFKGSGFYITDYKNNNKKSGRAEKKTKTEKSKSDVGTKG